MINWPIVLTGVVTAVIGAFVLYLLRRFGFLPDAQAKKIIEEDESLLGWF